MLKTRFCPSPTGRMHLGNARTALFNALLAYREQGVFLLRIEDSDEERSQENYTQGIFEDLKWMGLFWQEGPSCEKEEIGSYYQSQRHAVYEIFYNQLIEKNLAYPCYCTEEELALMRKLQQSRGEPPRYIGGCVHLSTEECMKKASQGLKPTLRFRVPLHQTVRFTDLVKGPLEFQTDDIGDFIIRRADGTSSFMFCNAIDDALMGVTHALRGEDHVTNTPRQLLILRALGLPEPQYGHISLILGMDGAPLSKRNGSRSISDLQQEGYLPIAVLNYLARLGHHYHETGLCSLEGLVKSFEISSLGNAPARFDSDQLKFWQKEAVHHLTIPEFLKWSQGTLQMTPVEKQVAFAELIRPNVCFPQEVAFWDQQLFGTTSFVFDADAIDVLKKAGKFFFETANGCIETHGVVYSQLKQTLQQELGVKGKDLFQPLRLALTGLLHGPELEPLLRCLGKEICLATFKEILTTV